MADVFISYAREDRPRAEQVARGLQATGLDCFWDTEIPPGQTWADYIESKLTVCKAVVVLWSAHSTGSQWVREEARMGRERGKLIPAMLDNSPAPFGFGEVQAANLASWRGEPAHPDWVRFINAVGAAVRGANSASTAPTPPPPPPQAPQPLHANAAQSDSPLGYIQKCLRLYANGAGRARRSEYGWFFSFNVVAIFAAAFVDVALFGLNPYTGQANYALTYLVWLALICPFISVGARRAHDIGQTGWLAALTAIPYLGFIAALALVFIPGQPSANKYGPDPKGI